MLVYRLTTHKPQMLMIPEPTKTIEARNPTCFALYESRAVRELAIVSGPNKGWPEGVLRCRFRGSVGVCEGI